MKARSIDTLVAHFAAHGTEGLNAAQTEEMNCVPKNGQGWTKPPEVLLNHRLAYRSESNVNCVPLSTVLANDEVKDGLSERGGHPVVQKK